VVNALCRSDYRVSHVPDFEGARSFYRDTLAYDWCRKITLR
jgi:hypothetical protein